MKHLFPLYGVLLTVGFLGGSENALSEVVSYTHPATPCEIPSGTWKESCGPWYTLVKDAKGCSFSATCGDKGKERDYTHSWRVIEETPELHFCGESFQKKTCAA